MIMNKVPMETNDLRTCFKDLQRGMKMLGLNPSDQELLDIPNRISKNGLIYYPDFCQLCLECFRQEPAEEEEFRRNMFKVGTIAFIALSNILCIIKILCGTDPLPTDHRAKKYRVDKHFLCKVSIKILFRILLFWHQNFILVRIRTPYEKPTHPSL